MVFNLRCQHGHRFEGWFRSSDAYITQRANAQVRCPICESAEIEKLLTAPRLNLGASSKADKSVEGEADQPSQRGETVSSPLGASSDEKATTEPSKMPEIRPSSVYGKPSGSWDGTLAQQAILDNAVRALRRKIMAETEDVGRKFADVARAMTRGDEEQRGIRGTVTPKEADALADEGINTTTVPKGFLEDEKLH